MPISIIYLLLSQQKELEMDIQSSPGKLGYPGSLVYADFFCGIEVYELVV